jgi:predicted AAA+ superfamily ATPase
VPHNRPRLISPLILNSLKCSPAVGLFGLRQAGKTTLASELTLKKGGVYLTLDSGAMLDSSRVTPELFCTRKKLLCIDEAQRAPWLFPAIKNVIGTQRKPGKFLLTGSIRFTLKKDIREALTGRIVLHELLPFNPAEAHGQGASSLIADLFENLSTQKSSIASLRKYFDSVKVRLSAAQILHHMIVGGLPIPCFTREEPQRINWYNSYFETLITRDLPLADTSLHHISYSQGISFLRQLALMQSKEISLSELARASSFTLPKAKKVLEALAALSLINFVVPEMTTDNATKKLRIAWKDIGLWNHLVGVPRHLLIHDAIAMGVMIGQELRTQISLIQKTIIGSSYRHRNGASVPWILKQGQATLAITQCSAESPSPYDYRSLKSLLAKRKNCLGLVLGAEKSPIMPLTENIWLLPYTCLF